MSRYTHKTLFRRIPNGTRFKALNGDILIKRSGSSRSTFCQEEGKNAPLNAIIPGLAMCDASRKEFTHMCPLDCVLI
jgi:hypothetical protein